MEEIGMRGKKRMKRRNHCRKHMMVFMVFAAVVIAMCGVSAVNATEEAPQRYKYYTTVYVDRGATLWNISKKYVTDEYTDIRAYMDEVKSINHLTDDKLQYGTKICVPYYSEEYKS